MTITEDPSTRFLFDADSPLTANLAALWACDARLAMLAEKADATRCHVDPAKSGEPTLSWTDDAGRVVQLHSRYNPLDEARRLADSLDTSSALLLFIHGFGLGYHVDEIVRRASKEAILFVFEPRIEIVRAACEHRDLTKLLQSGRVAIVNDLDKASLFAALMPHAAMTSFGTAILRHPPSVQTAPGDHANSSS